MKLNLSSQEEEALKILSPWKYHCLFTLPGTENHGPLKVSYSIAGIEDGDIPTILLVGGMMCTRWHSIGYEHLAQKEGVRVLSIDRPGFGGSTEVPLPQRIPIYLETIPLLLAHLKIPTISLLSHSAGTIYALNLLHTHPSLLSPSTPSITLLSPWVHQSHTSVSFLLAAAKLPNQLLNFWNDINGFVWNTAGPTLASSSGALAMSSGWFTSKGDQSEKAEAKEKRCRECYGLSDGVRKEVERLTGKFIFEESTRGVNDEARLCLKSIEGTGWLACEDYGEFVKDLNEFWEREVEQNGVAGKLRVKIVFPEDDVMVGVKGKKYFEERWTKEKCGKGIEVECVEVKGTDHDSVLAPENGVIGEVFAVAKETYNSR